MDSISVKLPKISFRLSDLIAHLKPYVKRMIVSEF
jgi:hypothetical protein